MSKYEVIEELARGKVVEHFVENTAKCALDANLSDLVQMVYLILLEYDDDKILDLYAKGEIKFFIARIIMNQFNSSLSPYHWIFRRHHDKVISMGVGAEINDDTIRRLNNWSKENGQ